MRGARMNFLQRERAKGITPAYAGRTVFIQSFDGREWDHPRVCGAHVAVKYKI